MRAMGQFCFDNDAIARFRDRVAAAHLRADRSRPDADDELQGRGAHGGTLRREHSLLASRLYDGLDDDLESRASIAASVLAEQVRSFSAWLRPVPFLYPEPGRPHLCDVPDSGPAVQTAKRDVS